MHAINTMRKVRKKERSITKKERKRKREKEKEKEKIHGIWVYC